MSGIVLALAGRTTGPPAPTVIGQAYGGGFYAGQIGVSGVATHYLIVAPASTGQATRQFSNQTSVNAGATSDIDGQTNTATLVAAGNSTVYPAPHFCNDLVIGAYTDWYLPATNELEVCYYNLKPTTQVQSANGLTSGINPNSIPPRAGFYTAGNPTQTTATDFRDTGAEDFVATFTWVSTEGPNPVNGKIQAFGYGAQQAGTKTNSFQTRAIRREPV
jgi:hypothetical protein